MTSSRMTLRILAALALAAVLAGCNERRDPGFQGWVEADMIFVSPDETGRVTKLNVREGDEVKPGAPLYSVDDDLQQADLNQNNATLANAQQTYDRAASLSKTGSGTQANLDSGGVGAARRRGAGQHLADAAGAAQRLCAGQRHHSADLFPRGRDGAGAAAGAVDHAARQHEACASSCRRPDLPKLAIGDEVKRDLRQLRGRSHREDLFHRDHRPNTPRR